jgi:hypothetical protein
VFVNVHIIAIHCLIYSLSLFLYALYIFVTRTLLPMTNCLSWQCPCFPACPKSPYMCLVCYSLTLVFLSLSLSSCLSKVSLYVSCLLLSVIGFPVLIHVSISLQSLPIGILSPYFLTFMETRNRFQGMNSASQCSLAGRYNNPISTRFLAPIDCLKIPAVCVVGCFPVFVPCLLSVPTSS